MAAFRASAFASALECGGHDAPLFARRLFFRLLGAAFVKSQLLMRRAQVRAKAVAWPPHSKARRKRERKSQQSVDWRQRELLRLNHPLSFPPSLMSIETRRKVFLIYRPVRTLSASRLSGQEVTLRGKETRHALHHCWQRELRQYRDLL